MYYVIQLQARLKINKAFIQLLLFPVWQNPLPRPWRGLSAVFPMLCNSIQFNVRGRGSELPDLVTEQRDSPVRWRPGSKTRGDIVSLTCRALSSLYYAYMYTSMPLRRVATASSHVTSFKFPRDLGVSRVSRVSTVTQITRISQLCGGVVQLERRGRLPHPASGSPPTTASS